MATHYTYTTLTAAIKSYTEVDATIFTQAIIDEFIMAAEHRINIDCPMDSDRQEWEGTIAADVNTVRVPAGFLFVRGVEIFNASNSTEQGTWLEKKDQTYLSEFVGRLTGPEGDLTAQDVTGKPKYYAMFRSHNKLINNSFPQGLLYACLVEAYGFLKGPMEMLTLYENKYKTSIQQFAGMQLGRRRRDDYTDGTVRIQVKSPSP